MRVTGPRVTLTRGRAEYQYHDTSLADEMLGLLRSGDKHVTLACEQNGIDASMLESLPSESFGVVGVDGSADVLKMREANHKKQRAALARIVQQRCKHLESESRRAEAQVSRRELLGRNETYGLLAHMGTNTTSAANLANGLTSSWMLGLTGECELAQPPTD